MKIDIDTYHEILDTLTRNKARSFLTGFGVFWGVFMLVTLIGGGAGLKEMLNSNFEGFATNTAMVWAQPTTKPYKGFQKGRQWDLVYKDVQRIKEQVPELDVVSPVVSLFSGGSIVYGDKKAQPNIYGVMPDYAKVDAPKMRYGRYINEMDITLKRKVCVIGDKIYKTLFTDGVDPCGKMVRIDSTYYSVVGVDCHSSNMNMNGRAEERVTLPLTLMQKSYNLGDNVHMISLTGKKGVVMSSLAPKIRQVVGRAHSVSPDDEKGIMVFNTEVLFGMMDNLFSGVNFLIWLVGIGTLIAGAIGVSNIMLVTVKERTTEIGIRRAIGATPRMILSQIIAESLVLTAVAGMSGILFSVLVLQMLEMGNTTDGVVETHFQIGFWTAIGAALLLSVLGVMAGLAPALRAMAVKPVDAMRDE